MKAEFTAIIEAAPEGGFWAICPEVPGANGQGETIEETKANLRQAIEWNYGSCPSVHRDQRTISKEDFEES